MPKIFDFGGREVERSITVAGLRALRQAGRRVAQATAETADEAAAAEAAGIEMVVCRAANVARVREGSRRVFVTAALGFAANALAREAVLTNHGELPIGSHYGSLKLDCIWPAILAGFGGEEQIILAATMNGSICLTQSAAAPLPGLLETMRGVLAANV